MPEQRAKTWARRLAGLAGLLALVLGLAVIAGWHLHLSSLVQVHPAFVPMQYNTALGFVLCGLGLAALGWARSRPAIPAWVPGVALVAGLAASVCLWQALTAREARVLAGQEVAGEAVSTVPEWTLAAVFLTSVLICLLLALLRRNAREVAIRVAAQARLAKLNAELEERVAEATRELRQANEELTQFAYVASHDLQEPLRAVTGCLQLLEREYTAQLDDEARELMQHAVDGGLRMKILIQDLLALSRVDSKARAPSCVDSRAALEEALENLAAARQESGARVTHDPLPQVLVDRTHLVQLFQNLISNAIKFRGQAPPEVHVTARREGDFHRFSVRDRGIGIEPRHQDKIFVLFQRLHGRGDYPGTGIGLALCKKIVVRSGGTIGVESTPGEGSTFFFTLPGCSAQDEKTPGEKKNLL